MWLGWFWKTNWRLKKIGGRIGFSSVIMIKIKIIKIKIVNERERNEDFI